MLCCLLCLTVCVVPALAGSYNESGGFLYWSPDTDIIVTNSGNSFAVLNGHFPASFSTGREGDNNPSLTVVGSPMARGSSDSWTAQTASTFYVEVLYTVPAPLDVTRETWSGANVQGSMFFGSATNSTAASSKRVYAADISAVVDGELIPLVSGSTADSFVVDAGTFHVKRYWGYRMYFNPLNLTWISSIDNAMKVQNTDFYRYTFSDPNYSEGIYDNVTVNTGIVQEINGTLTDIKASTSIIQQDVSEIKGGLQDSNSSIWQSFKDSVSGLFVPSSDDLAGLKDDFDSLAELKLGGAYQAFEYADLIVDVANNKLKNPGSSPGVEFPGISVPLGGDIGTVTLAASQTVTIPEEITSVLYPVAGVIIPIVCVIWTIRQCADMVECFMSGMSYAEFLHRNSDAEDDEI